MSAMPDAAPTTQPLDRSRVMTARNAVFVIFALAGLVFASWASRIADTKEALAGLEACPRGEDRRYG